MAVACLVDPALLIQITTLVRQALVVCCALGLPCTKGNLGAGPAGEAMDVPTKS
jgi:hypothetical protein